MDLKGRKVTRFRTHLDPMIGGKPRNAFDLSEFPGAIFEITAAGIYVKVPVRHGGGPEYHEEEHIVPYANVQSIKLASTEVSKERKAS